MHRRKGGAPAALAGTDSVVQAILPSGVEQRPNKAIESHGSVREHPCTVEIRIFSSDKQDRTVSNIKVYTPCSRKLA